MQNRIEPWKCPTCGTRSIKCAGFLKNEKDHKQSVNTKTAVKRTQSYTQPETHSFLNQCIVSFKLSFPPLLLVCELLTLYMTRTELSRANNCAILPLAMFTIE
jgi:hypothetical protein